MTSEVASPWFTAAELGESVPEEPDYLVRDLIIKGAITELSAKIKAGKSTFVGKLLSSMMASEDFISLPTRRCTVLWLTEEGPNTFRALLERSGLLGEPDLHVLMRGMAPRGMGWADLVAHEVYPKAMEVGAALVVVDTLSRWAGMKADEENMAGAAAQAVEPLELLRNAGIGVLTIHHDRKGEGDIGDSARGSSAWGGAGDILLRLSNGKTYGHPNRRKLEMLGRFSDPAIWNIELIEGEYVNEGSSSTVERADAKRQIPELISLGPLSLDQLVSLTGIARSTVNRAAKELVKEELICQEGKGTKGSPILFTPISI